MYRYRLDFNMADPERPQTLPQDFDTALVVLNKFHAPPLQAWLADLRPNIGVWDYSTHIG